MTVYGKLPGQDFYDLFLKRPSFETMDHFLYCRHEDLLFWRTPWGDPRFCNFSIPSGWYPLIAQLLDNIADHLDKGCDDAPRITETLDKRGNLCIRYDGGCDWVDEAICDCEDASRLVCIYCGVESLKDSVCELCKRRPNPSRG